MAKVTVRQPQAGGETATATAPKPDILEATDSRGRKLTIKKLTLLEEMNLMVAAGANKAAIPKWMQYASVVACVRSIDGERVDMPLTSRILDANVALVGSEGFAAAVAVLYEDLPEDVREMAADDAVATAKN